VQAAARSPRVVDCEGHLEIAVSRTVFIADRFGTDQSSPRWLIA